MRRKTLTPREKKLLIAETAGRVIGYWAVKIIVGTLIERRRARA